LFGNGTISSSPAGDTSRMLAANMRDH